MNKSLQLQNNLNLYRLWYESYMELDEDYIPQMKAVNYLRRIDKKTITYENDLPVRKRIWLSDKKVKYVQDISFV